MPGVTGKPKKAGLAALQKKFEAWFKKHTSLLEPLETPAAEVLRKRVYNIGRQMIRDGRSKVYTSHCRRGGQWISRSNETAKT